MPACPPARVSVPTQVNITRCLNCPVFEELAAIEDPKVYLDRFIERNVPIISISSVGDEFFLPDSSQWWYYDYTGTLDDSTLPLTVGSQPGTDATMPGLVRDVT